MRKRMIGFVTRWTWRKLVVVAMLAGAGIVAFVCSRSGPLPQATAQQPAPQAAPQPQAEPPAPQPVIGPSQRVVAFIHGTIPVTRDDLADYLIARYGADKVELVVNKKIIELACQQLGVECTELEIDAALAEDLKGLGVNQSEFVNRVLKHYKKTLYEWREDVLRPKILMGKVARPRVQVTDEDLQKAFEAYHGEKVDGRMILWPRGEENVAYKVYGEIRDSEEAFDRAARQQANPRLAANGGRVPQPIGRHTTGSETLEKEIFLLQPGELSRVIGTPEGAVVFKCDRRIPPDAAKSLEQERPKLEKEIIDKKIVLEIPKVFEELRQAANPQILIKRDVVRPREQDQQVEQEIKPLYQPPGK
jgi:hypothetical protein